MKLYMQLEKRSKYTAGSASSPLLPLKVDIVVVTAPDERTGIERGQRFFCVRRENRQRIKPPENQVGGDFRTKTGHGFRLGATKGFVSVLSR